MERDDELSEFLRSRRARVTPAEAGLGPGAGVRRVPGLRREEVARLAGVNVDYYVRLERGRRINPSDSVLDAVARALRLNATERAHLFALVRPGSTSPARRSVPPQRVRPSVHRILDAHEPLPAMVLGRRMDVLAANRPARALYTDWEALPGPSRNMVRFLFTDPAARGVLVDWAGSATEAVAHLRLYQGRYPADPLLADLVADLSAASEDFRDRWADHDVHQHTHGAKSFNHPVAGRFTLAYELLGVLDDADQFLTLYTAEPGSASEAAVRHLRAASIADA
ncbi:helix-turn-helix transcriptional regulator [Amycolatopsis sp. NPDC005232]|uniref:helix-turn-helix domain-containing protein n=1 Tax=Amycolatopsis sp. NPDC005232 TaxID=3157027 RepID=UPI0033B5BAA5